MRIRLAQITDFHAYWQHLRRHQLESGRDGDEVFLPASPLFEADESLAEREKERTLRQKIRDWEKSPSELGWERVWILTDEESVRGELRLRHHQGMRSTLHRAHVAIGVERGYRGQGYGTELLRAAIEFSHQHPSIEYLDLYVFAHNEGAISLYRRMGFEELGRVNDLFRIEERRIDDIHMSLRLRSETYSSLGSSILG